MQFTPLSTEIDNSDQNVNFVEIGTTCETWLKGSPGLRYRITIRSNAYKFQSYARIEVWSTERLRWNEVAGIGSSNMKTRAGLYIAREVTRREFAEDRAELLDRFAQVLQ
jgi:hypothetical protein